MEEYDNNIPHMPKEMMATEDTSDLISNALEFVEGLADAWELTEEERNSYYEKVCELLMDRITKPKEKS